MDRPNNSHYYSSAVSMLRLSFHLSLYYPCKLRQVLLLLSALMGIGGLFLLFPQKSKVPDYAGIGIAAHVVYIILCLIRYPVGRVYLYHFLQLGVRF